jgi:hypothetical protein
VTCNTCFHRRRDSQSLMDAAEVVVHEVERRHGRRRSRIEATRQITEIPSGALKSRRGQANSANSHSIEEAITRCQLKAIRNRAPGLAVTAS